MGVRADLIDEFVEFLVSSAGKVRKSVRSVTPGVCEVAGHRLKERDEAGGRESFGGGLGSGVGLGREEEGDDHQKKRQSERSAKLEYRRSPIPQFPKQTLVAEKKESPEEVRTSHPNTINSVRFSGQKMVGAISYRN